MNTYKKKELTFLLKKKLNHLKIKMNEKTIMSKIETSLLENQLTIQKKMKIP